jgi:hypothetical protein
LEIIPDEHPFPEDPSCGLLIAERREFTRHPQFRIMAGSIGQGKAWNRGRVQDQGRGCWQVRSAATSKQGSAGFGGEGPIFASRASQQLEGTPPQRGHAQHRVTTDQPRQNQAHRPDEEWMKPGSTYRCASAAARP